MDKLLLLDPKPGDLSKTRLQKRIERVNVALFSEEFWKGAKYQSYLVIAGFLPKHI
jgi:hypothetical protein